jgi:hypothetical protein
VWISGAARKAVLIAMAAGLFASATVATADAATKPKSKPSLSVSAAAVASGKPVKFSGKLGVGQMRSVLLQEKRWNGWVTVADKISSTSGTFSFTYKPTVVSTTTLAYRVFAPSFYGLNNASKVVKRAAITTPITKVRVTPPVGIASSNPYAAGKPFALGRWGFVLGKTDTDAWPEIQVADPSNTEPQAGWSYVMTPVTFTNKTSGTAKPSLNTLLQFLGNDGATFDDNPDDQTCGTLPQSALDLPDLAPGASATGNVCAVVLTSAIAGGVWRVQAFDAPSGPSSGVRFVAIG